MTSANSKKTFYVSLSVLLLIAAAVAVLLVKSGNASPQVKQRAFVDFNHESHIEYASDCMDCHHKYENDDFTNNVLEESELEEDFPDGELVLNMIQKEDLSEVKCASCHNYKAKTVSRDAFHLQCIGCHEQDGGPLMCGECHVNTNTASDED